MRILVCIKQVPDTAEVKIDPETHTLIREGVENVVNPLDAFAIEEALRLKKRFGGEAVALSMGPPQAAEALREAVALGADRGILISGREFAGSDTWSTAHALACAARRLEPFDIVLCGKQAIDGDTAQVGPEMAEMLDLPQVTYVSEIVGVTDGRLRTRSIIEGGHAEIETEMPCVLTAVKELNEPRLPTLAGRMRGRRYEPEVWDAKAIDADPTSIGLEGSPTRVMKVFPPEIDRVTRKIESLEPASLREVADFIRDHVNHAATH